MHSAIGDLSIIVMFSSNSLYCRQDRTDEKGISYLNKLLGQKWCWECAIGVDVAVYIEHTSIIFMTDIFMTHIWHGTFFTIMIIFNKIYTWQEAGQQRFNTGRHLLILNTGSDSQSQLYLRIPLLGDNIVCKIPLPPIVGGIINRLQLEYVACLWVQKGRRILLRDHCWPGCLCTVIG